MPTVSRRRWLIVPIETKARELEAKMLLALCAAERGWGVVIGSKAATRGAQASLPRGVVLEKSIHPGRLPSLLKAKAFGNRVSALCEEGLLYLSRDDYNQRRLEPESVDAIDYFFAWGQQQADDVDLGRDKVVVSGNPRFDLLRPEWRGVFQDTARRITARYGRIILVNTKFSLVNHGLAGIGEHGDYLGQMKATGRIKDEAHEGLWRRYLDVQEGMFREFLRMVPRLSEAFDDYTIVVRPHPSEDDRPWVKLAKGLPNVHVVYEGNVNNWIVASEVTVHNNCTTGIEAFLLGRPVVSYRPVKDEEVEFELPHRVSLQAEDEEALFSRVRNVLDHEANNAVEYGAQRAYAARYIANLDGHTASETIMDSLESLELPVLEGHFSGRLDEIVVQRVKQVRRRLAAFSRAHGYGYRKFPGITSSEVQHLLERFQHVSGRFARVEVARTNAGGFCVYEPSPGG